MIKAYKRKALCGDFRLVSRALATSIAMTAMVGTSYGQPQFSNLVSFGGSYADSGVRPFPSHGAPVEDIAATSRWVAVPYWMQEELGLSNAQVTNYAIGGSTTQALNATGSSLSLPTQLETWGGKPFAKNDIVVITAIEANDAIRASGILGGLFPGAPDGLSFDSQAAVDLADLATDTMQATVQSFSNAGARTVMIASFSDISGLPAAVRSPNRDSLRVYGENVFSSLQEKLEPISQAGTRVFLIDTNRILLQVQENLSSFGLESFLFNGNNSASLFGVDGIHLTNRGFEILSSYMVNVLSAPYSHGLQTKIAQADMGSFTNTVISRLDSLRPETGIDDGERFMLYALGTHEKTNQDDTNDLSGYDSRSNMTGLGGELRINSTNRVGIAIAALNADADFDNKDQLSHDSTQLAAYWSFYDGQWFGDALLGYGWHDLGLDRSGIFEDVTGDTDASSLSIALRGGYLFDLGAFKFGPLAGLHYTRTKVDGYDEGGDPLLSFKVDSQDLSSKIGEIGAQLRSSFAVRNKPMDAYVNISWRHEFGDQTRTVSNSLHQSAALPIHTSIENFESRNYGLLSGGATVPLSKNLSISAVASSTFAAEDASQYQLGATLNYRF